MNQKRVERTAVDRVCRLDEEMAEICLLLPAWQVTALEGLARARNLTPGQLVRSLIQEHLACRVGPGTVGDAGQPGRCTRERGAADLRAGNRPGRRTE